MELLILPSLSNLFPRHTPTTSLPNRTTSSPSNLVVGATNGGKASPKVEIRVCVNKACGRQGSREVFLLLSDIAPPSVSVSSCGCLGRCGAGPNLVVLPDEVLLGHCGTPARAAEVVSEVLRGAGECFDPRRTLEALALRKKAEVELTENSNAVEAEAIFSQAIALNPSGGLHLLYKSRSAARLALGNHTAALEDAKESSRIAPTYPQAYICQGDAFMAMEVLDAAEQAYSTALELDPSIRRSKSLRARVLKLQEKLASAST